MLKKMFALFACAVAIGALAADLPYDEKADAHADLTRALEKAKSGNKKVLAVFGANWCPDCREFDKALHGKSASLVDSKFVVVKIDVGNFNKNIDLAKEYGNPIKKGIPAAVVLTPDNKVVYATKGGELANARGMGESGIYDFFSRITEKSQ
jgi:protein disulfide-isomerase